MAFICHFHNFPRELLSALQIILLMLVFENGSVLRRFRCPGALSPHKEVLRFLFDLCNPSIMTNAGEQEAELKVSTETLVALMFGQHHKEVGKREKVVALPSAGASVRRARPRSACGSSMRSGAQAQSAPSLGTSRNKSSVSLTDTLMRTVSQTHVLLLLSSSSCCCCCC